MGRVKPSETRDGVCVGQGCASNADCPSGQVCIDGVCVDMPCTDDSDCPPGYICQYGTCVTYDCNDNADCPPGYVCRDGTCGLCKERWESCNANDECCSGRCAGWWWRFCW